MYNRGISQGVPLSGCIYPGVPGRLCTSGWCTREAMYLRVVYQGVYLSGCTRVYTSQGVPGRVIYLRVYQGGLYTSGWLTSRVYLRVVNLSGIPQGVYPRVYLSGVPQGELASLCAPQGVLASLCAPRWVCTTLRYHGGYVPLSGTMVGVCLPMCTRVGVCLPMCTMVGMYYPGMAPWWVCTTRVWHPGGYSPPCYTTRVG